MLLAPDELGIDLGTSHVQVCIKGHGVVVREPSVVAFSDTRHRPTAFGAEARQMLDRGVPGVTVIRPLKGGVVAHFEAAEELLRHVIRAALGRRTLIAPTVVASVTANATDVEKRALHDAVKAAGGGKVRLVPKSLAAAIGTGEPVDDAAARLVVDIGAGTTEIGVIALGTPTGGTSLRYAGDDFDEAIRRALRLRDGIALSSSAAEELKVKVGSVDPELAREPVKLDGFLAPSNGSPSPPTTINDIPDILAKSVVPIIGEIRWLTEELPPERRAEVMQSGITLSGGSALLRGLAPLIEQGVGASTRVARDPLSCTILGIEAVLEDLRRLTHDGMRYRRPQHGLA